ncbi:glycosyl transferase family 1 [Rhizobium favelukesii]|uniref:Glucosyltransferase protein n=1 Tax=Rhizobium favelukesii TaxID=348824 RepID=W6RGK9_9HYPH|nr:glycosyl transferase family 1 [Rhizobium favelukesii]MCS0463364.1 glycosyl transferase family 1 [Rhizobium favelukesii]CDM59939.1 putative glucosyltransferase protein [Rhizobium favelukesii]
MLKVLYLAHDLTDPAIRRRTLVLEAGGADVTLAGFRRGAAAPEDTRAIELGVTRDGRFVQRIAAVAKSAMRLGAKLRGAAKPDVIIARNLEMLALANRANAVFGGKVPIVYECLDIHRLLLRQDAVGRILRGAEHALGRKISLLITSSPAFIENYFRPLSRLEAPILLLENQVVALDDDRAASLPAARPPLSGKPFKIGWFGALRCRKSLYLLADFSRAMNGMFEAVLRGRPAYSEFEDFDGFVRNEPFMTYQGPYRNPEDLADIYNEVQFSWAIDFFEEGLNSSWLLPNRLYEGCRYGTVPIAMRGTETARYTGARGLGLVLDHADAATLATLLSTMTAERYLSEFDRVAATDPRHWTFDRGDARALVTRLSELRTQAAPTGPLLQDLHQTQRNKGGLL